MFATKIDSGLDMQVVSAWRQRFLTIRQTRPDFYSGDNDITVGLPQELLQYSNAAAGHSGYDSGARPVGIRYTVDNPQRTLTKIFESDESFARFISGSDCSGPAYSQAKRQDYYNRHGYWPGKVTTVQVIPSDPLDLPISQSNLEQLYGPGTIQRLRNSYPKTVLNDYRTLTRREFEARYNLTATAPVSV